MIMKKEKVFLTRIIEKYRGTPKMTQNKKLHKLFRDHRLFGKIIDLIWDNEEDGDVSYEDIIHIMKKIIAEAEEAMK